MATTVRLLQDQDISGYPFKSGDLVSIDTAESAWRVSGGLADDDSAAIAQAVLDGRVAINVDDFVDDHLPFMSTIKVTTSIQSALDKLPVSGGTVFVPNGFYRESIRVTKDNTRLIAESFDTVVKISDDAVLYGDDPANSADSPIRIFADHCEVSGFTFDGNGANQPDIVDSASARKADGIGIFGNNNFIHHNKFIAMKGHGIIIWNEAFTGYDGTNNWAVGSRKNNSITNNYVDGSLAMRNVVDDASSDSATVNGGLYDLHVNQDNHFISNRIIGSVGAGAGSVLCHTAWRTKFLFNVVENTSIGYHTNSRDVEIRGNVILNSLVSGIKLIGDLALADVPNKRGQRSFILDNIIKNAGINSGSCIDISNQQDVTVKGNKLFDHGSGVGGITFGNYIDNVEISDNLIVGGAKGIDQIASSEASNMKIVNNIIKDISSTGIEINRVVDSLIGGNKVTVVGDGIDAITSTGTSSRDIVFKDNVVNITGNDSHGFECFSINNQFIGNTVVTSAGACIRAGENNIIRNNKLTSSHTGYQCIRFRSTLDPLTEGEAVSNNLNGSNAGNAIVDQVSGMKIKDNSLYITENNGADTIADAASSVVVSHGLTIAPVSISLTASANESVWYGTITATTFTINRAGISGSLAVSWRADV